MSPDEAIAAAAAVEAETRYRDQLAREMYQAGHADGYRAGYRQAELEQRRWGPGGREAFANPRPGDFPGRLAQPRPEPQTEPEMEATP
jgi:hypothetical protein